jgi:hypothetical protein
MDETNAAHIPGLGDGPIDLHSKPIGGSTLSDELAAGTVIVPSQPMPTLIDSATPAMSHHTLWGREPSGAKITDFSPTSGPHDVDSKGRAV